MCSTANWSRNCVHTQYSAKLGSICAQRIQRVCSDLKLDLDLLVDPQVAIASQRPLLPGAVSRTIPKTQIVQYLQEALSKHNIKKTISRQIEILEVNLAKTVKFGQTVFISLQLLS